MPKITSSEDPRININADSASISIRATVFNHEQVDKLVDMILVNASVCFGDPPDAEQGGDAADGKAGETFNGGDQP